MFRMILLHGIGAAFGTTEPCARALFIRSVDLRHLAHEVEPRLHEILTVEVDDFVKGSVVRPVELPILIDKALVEATGEVVDIGALNALRDILEHIWI